jgi:hypothetical protein
VSKFIAIVGNRQTTSKPETQISAGGDETTCPRHRGKVKNQDFT